MFAMHPLVRIEILPRGLRPAVRLRGQESEIKGNHHARISSKRFGRSPKLLTAYSFAMNIGSDSAVQILNLLLNLLLNLRKHYTTQLRINRLD